MMCPHCGKSIPDGSETCPVCGQSTDFARRSHYRETDSPIKTAAAAGVGASALTELEAKLTENNNALRASLDESRTQTRRALIVAVAAVALSALCLGLSFASLNRNKALGSNQADTRSELETLAQTQKTEAEALSADAEGLKADITRLEKELREEKDRTTALQGEKEAAEQELQALREELEALEERTAALEKNWAYIKSTEYSLSFDLNQSEAKGTTPASIRFRNGDNPSLETPECEGYRFVGWSDKKDGSGKLYTSSYTGKGKNVTLYAQWEEIPG